MGKAEATMPMQSIVDIASGNEAFSTLVSLVTQAELVDTLSSAGPFTVFAPTNDAFAKLPADAVAYLTAPENKEALQKVLTYHVVSGKVMSTDLSAGAVGTVEGQSVSVSLNPVMINKANVATADVEASNGVIHVIDSVLIPEGVLPEQKAHDGHDHDHEEHEHKDGDELTSGSQIMLVGKFVAMSNLLLWTINFIMA